MRRALSIFGVVALSAAAAVVEASASGSAALTLPPPTAATCSGRALGAAAPYQLPFGQPSAIAVADFTGDGRLDVVAASANDAALASGVTLFAGTSAGTLAPAGSTGGLKFIQKLVADDFNGDGIPDLAASVFYFSGSVQILLGDGAGGFHPSEEFGADFPPQLLTGGDFNGDGFTAQ